MLALTLRVHPSLTGAIPTSRVGINCVARAPRSCVGLSPVTAAASSAAYVPVRGSTDVLVRRRCVPARLFDAFSTMLPVGERFFIEALRRAADELADPALTALVNQFAQQEAVHSREHRRYNERLAAEGIDLERWDHSQKRVMRRILRARDTRIPVGDYRRDRAHHRDREPGRARGWRARSRSSDDPGVLGMARRRRARAQGRRDRRVPTPRRRSWASPRPDGVGGIRDLDPARCTPRFVAAARRGIVRSRHLACRTALRARDCEYSGSRRLARELGDYFQRDFHPWSTDDYHLVERWEQEALAC